MADEKNEKKEKKEEQGTQHRVDTDLPPEVPGRGSVEPKIIGKGSNPNIFPGVGGAAGGDVGEHIDIGAGSTELPEGSAGLRTDEVTSPPDQQAQQRDEQKIRKA